MHNALRQLLGYFDAPKVSGYFDAPKQSTGEPLASTSAFTRSKGKVSVGSKHVADSTTPEGKLAAVHGMLLKMNEARVVDVPVLLQQALALCEA